MGHESLSALSPAHRRNQNPMSPSASMFRRSSTFSRDDGDLSWIALIRRHRFLLLMLVLLVFLCTIYLYFAITLGENDCSSLSGKEAALCRLKKSKIKTSHGHGHKASRRLLSDHQSLLALLRGNDPDTKVKTALDAASWIQHMPSNVKSLRILNLGCRNGKVIEHTVNRFNVTKLLFDCEEETLLDRSQFGLQEQPQFSAYLFDLIICSNCNKLALMSSKKDSNCFREFEPLLKDGGYFLWVSDSFGGSADRSLQNADMQVPGWICLSRNRGISLWQKLTKSMS